MQELLKILRLFQQHEDGKLLLASHVRLAAPRLDALLNPGPHRLVLDVHVFVTDGAAISLPQDREDVAQRGRRQAFEIAAEGLVEIGFGQAELFESEFEVDFRRRAERVEVGRAMAEIAVGKDQAQHADLRFGLGARSALQTEVEPFAKRPPSLIDRLRVRQPELILLLVDLHVLGGNDTHQTGSRFGTVHPITLPRSEKAGNAGRTKSIA